jgi:phenylacetate-CoA ligase
MNNKFLSAPTVHFVAKRLVSHFWIRRRWLAQTQWLSADCLSDLQLDLLKKTVRYAEHNVPYYQKLMKSCGFSSRDIRSLEDIRLFPILTKKDIIDARRDMVSRAFARSLLRRECTGGTTGTPLCVYRNYASIGNEHAFVRRQWDWAGLGFGDRCAYLRGRIIVGANADSPPLYRYDAPMKELQLSTYHLSLQTAPAYIDAMKKYRVSALAGYPSAVSLFARICLARNLSYPLKAVLTSSETLTACMRAEISKAFECRVFDFYGSVERVCYIFTCEHGCYHVQPEYGLTELIPVDNAVSGQCRVVSTGFWNKAMPLIRYDTGDLVVKGEEPCACRRAFPTIATIIGREGDVVKIPSGKEFGATLLITLLYVACGASNILESQFIQDAPDHLTVEYVPAAAFSPEDFLAARKKFMEHMSHDMVVDFRQVKAVRRTMRGKIRPVINLVSGGTARISQDVPQEEPVSQTA